MADNEPVAEARESMPLPEDRKIVPARLVFPQALSIIPLTNRPLFPGMMAPLTIEEKSVQKLVEEVVESGSRFVGLILARERPQDPAGGTRKAADLHGVGVLAEILQAGRMGPEGPLQVMLGVLGRLEVVRVIAEEPHIRVEVRHVAETEMADNRELKAFSVAVISSIKELLKLNPLFKEELKLFLSQSNLNEPGRLADFAAAMTTASGPELQDILETFGIRERIEKVLVLLTREIDISKLKAKISKQIEDKLSKQQREFFLREQLKAIKKELGLEKEGRETELDRFRARLPRLTLPDEARARIDEEMDKLSVLEPVSPEYTVSRNYLDWLTALPWGVCSKDEFDLAKARRILDEEHYGLADVKERILEFLSVGILKGRISGSILCFIGPPGVGKTSLGHSIARTIGRQFYRFSLGGMRDEAEIKGHRRTYIGALPGKFLQAVKTCGTANPVIMLDEIDKIGASFQGDPASALLEVLDPEQNRDFLDHYLDVRFDLSNILFICTGNQVDTIPPPLLDRMEMIKLPGYILEEKLQIAKRHLIPRQMEAHGLKPGTLRIADGALREVIDGYAREPGVRALENELKKIMRKATRRIVSREAARVAVGRGDVAGLLGKRIFTDTDPFKSRRPGVVMGLAWTSLGGATLYIEATPVAAREPGLKQTGQLGKVMVESSEIAYTYVRSVLGADPKARAFFESSLIHVHVPAGATPKDGPSAGITMAAALYSLAIGKPVRRRIAMTGELSLTGLVMPIGGVKEKTIAARRAGVRELIFPAENRKDFEEIPAHIRKGLRVHFVDRFPEVARLCFGDREASGGRRP